MSYQYPEYLDSMNLYIDDELCIENMGCPQPAMMINALDNTPIYHNFEDFEDTLAHYLTVGFEGRAREKSGFWKHTDFNQQGLRAWWEFKQVVCGIELHTAVFMHRSEKFDDFTNAAQPRPQNLVASRWGNLYDHIYRNMPLGFVDGPFENDTECPFKAGQNVQFLGNDEKTVHTGTLYRLSQNLIQTPHTPLVAEILQSERDSNGHRQRGLFVRADKLQSPAGSV